MIHQESVINGVEILADFQYYHDSGMKNSTGVNDIYVDVRHYPLIHLLTQRHKDDKMSCKVVVLIVYFRL